MRSWYCEGEERLEWTPERRALLAWILRQPHPGEYGIALLHLQAGFEPIRLPEVLLEIETRILKNALAAADGNITTCARLVGLNRTTCGARLRILGLINDDGFHGRARLTSIRIANSRMKEEV